MELWGWWGLSLPGVLFITHPGSPAACPPGGLGVGGIVSEDCGGPSPLADTLATIALTPSEATHSSTEGPKIAQRPTVKGWWPFSRLPASEPPDTIHASVFEASGTEWLLTTRSMVPVP